MDTHLNDTAILAAVVRHHDDVVVGLDEGRATQHDALDVIATHAVMGHFVLWHSMNVEHSAMDTFGASAKGGLSKI